MRRGSAVVLAAVAFGIAAVVGAVLLVPAMFHPHTSSTASLAPSFTVRDIYGQTFNLTSFRTHDVVVIEFTSLSCSECKIVEQTLAGLYASYNATGQSTVRILSVYIEPQFGDSIPALQAWHAQNNITWSMAQDTSDLALTHAYGVVAIPTVVIVDKSGYPVYDVNGPQSQSSLHSTIGQALAGTAPATTIVALSAFALAAVAGLTTFFSPCAFPMFPGYMSLFLGLNTNRAEPGAGPGSAYQGAARRALSAGTIAALGMMIVFLVIGLALVVAANAVSKYIPYFMVVVGAILIGLGALLLTNLQYWRIVAPLQVAWRRLGGAPAAEGAPGAVPASGRAFYVKLFSYGMGYAAAAAGCVAPVIFAAIVAGLALGLVSGIVSILIYSLTAALLMIGVTVVIAVAGQRYVNQLKAFTPVIKKVGAVVLVLVGGYLIYFFYTAWGFSPH